MLHIEATRYPGKGNVTLTGHIGEVMKESVQAALSLLRSRDGQLGVNSEDFRKMDIHVHVPAGAVPKDGPSAGIAMFTALASLFSNRAGSPRCGHDRRNHAARAGSADWRSEGKKSGSDARRDYHGHHPQAQRKRSWSMFPRKRNKNSNSSRSKTSMKSWPLRWRKTALRPLRKPSRPKSRKPEIRYCFFCRSQDLVDLAVCRGGSEFGGTRLAGRGEAHPVTACVYRVDAEHDFVVGRDGVHLLWCFRFVELDRPFLAGGVLCRSGEAERVTLEDDRCLDRLVLGQDVAVFHRRIEVPSAL